MIIPILRSFLLCLSPPYTPTLKIEQIALLYADLMTRSVIQKPLIIPTYRAQTNIITLPATDYVQAISMQDNIISM